jgi:hypothetical protein
VRGLRGRRYLDTGQVGNAIDLFMKIRGIAFGEAMGMLMSAAPPVGS